MPSIRSIPDEVVVDHDGTATILDVLVDADVPIVHECGGEARCSTCRVRVVEGFEAVGKRNRRERTMARRLDLPDEIRLACQTVAGADVTVQRLVLDEVDEALADQTLRKRGNHVGREVDLAVLFTDVVGYTALADALPAYDIVHILNRFFRAASGAVEGHGGRVDNYMGDAMLAFFQHDAAEEAACSAVCAGVQILSAASAMSDYVTQLYGRSFAVRVGIHHGRVVVGSIGGENSRRETAIGEAVNVASRLEAANTELGTDLLVSEEVARLCGDSIVLGPRHDVQLRGISGRTSAYEVVGVRA